LRSSSPLLHEAPDELRDLIRSGIEREMTGIEDVDFSLRHVAAISLRFRKLEGQVVFAPEGKCLRVRPVAVPEARANRGSNIRDEEGSPWRSRSVGASFGPASL